MKQPRDKRGRFKKNPTTSASRHQIRREDREDAAGIRRLKSGGRFDQQKYARLRRLRKQEYRRGAKKARW